MPPGPLSRIVLGLALALPAIATAGEEGEAAGEGETPPRVELEKLLELPASRDYSVESRGGATPGEWRHRFRRVREDLAAEREALEAAEAELEEVAGTTNPWQVGPALPGGNASQGEAPLDYRLRQKIRRHREEIERLERKLRELEVEASLAGVPASWREPEPEGGGSEETEARSPGP